MIEYLKGHSDVIVACISAFAAIIVGIISVSRIKKNGNKSLSQTVKHVKNSSVNQFGGNVNINGNYSANANNSNKIY